MGVITILKDEDVEIDDDALMECALEAGAADFIAEDEYYEIRTETDDVLQLQRLSRRQDMRLQRQR